MHIPIILTMAFAAVLPFASGASLEVASLDDDPASSEAASSAAEDACYTKSLNTGSGAAAAIKGFCGQVENDDSDTDNPASVADTAINGYTAGGFEPSYKTTTARLAAKKNCMVGVGSEEDCLYVFWNTCARGDKYGKGVAKKGCLEFRID
jgi:hypothetical protein